MPPKVPTRKRKPSVLILFPIFCFMFLLALDHTTMSVVVPMIGEDYQISHQQLGQIGLISGLGSIVSMLGGIFLSDLFLKNKQIPVCGVLIIAALLLMSTHPSFLLILLAFFILGVLGNYINLLSSAYLSEVRPNENKRFLNLGHLCFSLGAIVGPGCVTAVINRSGKWNTPYSLLAILFACITVCFLFVSAKAKPAGEPIRKQAPAAAEKRSFSFSQLFSVIRDPDIALLTVMSAVEGGYQGTISLWATSYVLAVAPSQNWICAFTIISYWAGVALGRIVFSIICEKISLYRWTTLANIVACVSMLIALWTQNILLYIIVLFVAGILVGPIYPSLIAVACDKHPSLSGLSSTVICLGSSIGASLIPWICGLLIDSLGFSFGLSPAPLFRIISIICTALLVKRAANERRG